MKRYLILASVCVIAAVAVTLLGNLIIVAEKAAELCHLPAVEYIVYGLAAALLIWALGVPLWRIVRAPALPALAPGEHASAAQLRSVANTLAANCAFIPDANSRYLYSSALKRRIAAALTDRDRLEAMVDEELHRRFDGDSAHGLKGVNPSIKECAGKVFMITAISQNGIFDAVSVLIVNFRMISELVREAGFRPGLKQMMKLYVNVLLTSVMSFAVSGALEDMDDITPFEGLNDGPDADDVADADDGGGLTTLLAGIKIPAIVGGSIIDGTANALMTLRIGYITRAYLLEGAGAFRGVAAMRRIRRQAVKEAFRTAPGIVKKGSAAAFKATAAMVRNIF